MPIEPTGRWRGPITWCALGAASLVASVALGVPPAAVALFGSLGVGAVLSSLHSRRGMEAILRSTEAAVRHQRALAALGRDATEGTELAVLHRRSVELLATALDCTMVTLSTVDARQLLTVEVSYGLPGAGAQVPIAADSQARFVLEDPTGIVIAADLDDEDRFVPPALLTAHGVLSSLSVRVGGRTEPYGILGLYSDRPGRFGPDDASFAEELASVLMLASERAWRSAELERMAFVDPLTGVGNRRALTTAIGDAQGPHGLALVDLDRFKILNDTFGHGAGDAVLQETAGRLAAMANPSSTVARLSGDQFAVLIPTGADPRRELQALADAITSAIDQPVTFEDGQLQTSATVGLALAEGGEHLLRHADLALLGAKERGSRRIVWFDAAAHDTLSRRRDLRDRLSTAVRTGSLQVAYQPVVNLHSGAICGMEALARWNDEQFGWVRPDIFIEVAEEIGLICDLGDVIMTKAIADFVPWQARYDVTLAVNVAPAQLCDPSLPQRTLAVVSRAGVDPARVTLELTEHAFRHQDEALEQLNRLHKLGFGLAIDDFGAAESTLGRLHELSADRLKLDRSLILPLDSHPDRTRRLLGAVVHVADALGLSTVCEGIETEEQFAAARSAGCQFGQGYLFSRPVPAIEMTALLRAERDLRVAQH